MWMYVPSLTIRDHDANKCFHFVMFFSFPWSCLYSKLKQNLITIILLSDH